MAVPEAPVADVTDAVLVEETVELDVRGAEVLEVVAEELVVVGLGGASGSPSLVIFKV